MIAGDRAPAARARARGAGRAGRSAPRARRVRRWSCGLLPAKAPVFACRFRRIASALHSLLLRFGQPRVSIRLYAATQLSHIATCRNGLFLHRVRRVKESLRRSLWAPVTGGLGVRFDDTLETVLAADLGTPFGVQSAWRQLVDLIGRRRVPADARALRILRAIRDEVPAAVRAASARGLEFADPPVPLVRLFALDELPIALPVLRSARMPSAEWIQLLPDLAPAARALLRNRRDLSPIVRRALESFGPIDFVLPDESVKEVAAELPVEATAVAESAPPIEFEVPAAVVAEPVATLPPEQLVDWTDVLESPAPEPTPQPVPEPIAAVPAEPAPAIEAPVAELALPEPEAPVVEAAPVMAEDFSFVALAGFAASLPNATILAPPAPAAVQSGTVEAGVPPQPIAEPRPTGPEKSHGAGGYRSRHEARCRTGTRAPRAREPRRRHLPDRRGRRAHRCLLAQARGGSGRAHRAARSDPRRAFPLRDRRKGRDPLGRGRLARADRRPVARSAGHAGGRHRQLADRRGRRRCLPPPRRLQQRAAPDRRRIGCGGRLADLGDPGVRSRQRPLHRLSRHRAPSARRRARRAGASRPLARRRFAAPARP